MTERRIAIDGVELETRWIGAAADQAPTIVMLHEGLGSVGLWHGFPEALAARTGYGVFLYSRAGYGTSDPVSLPRPKSYLHDEARAVLPRVLDEVGFERGLLLGHSDGASIATIYAGSHQDFRVHGLVLIAPHFFVEDVTIASIAAAKVEYDDGDLRAKLAKHHTHVDCAFRGWNDAWLAPGFRSWDIRETIGYIRVPILIVQGSRDPYGTAAQLRAAEDEAYCPVEIRVIDGAEHAPHLERPEETLEAVGSFIEDVGKYHGP